MKKVDFVGQDRLAQTCLTLAQLESALQTARRVGGTQTKQDLRQASFLVPSDNERATRRVLRTARSSASCLRSCRIFVDGQVSGQNVEADLEVEGLKVFQHQARAIEDATVAHRKAAASSLHLSSEN